MALTEAQLKDLRKEAADAGLQLTDEQIASYAETANLYGPVNQPMQRLKIPRDRVYQLALLEAFKELYPTWEHSVTDSLNSENSLWEMYNRPDNQSIKCFPRGTLVFERTAKPTSLDSIVTEEHRKKAVFMQKIYAKQPKVSV